LLEFGLWEKPGSIEKVVGGEKNRPRGLKKKGKGPPPQKGSPLSRKKEDW